MLWVLTSETLPKRYKYRFRPSFPTVLSVNSHISFATVKVDVPAPRTKSGDLMVESADIELIHRDLLDTCVALVSAPSQRGWVHWSYSKEYCEDADGDVLHSTTDVTQQHERGHGGIIPSSSYDGQLFPSVSELWTGDWWRDTEHMLPCFSSDEIRRILAVGIATDETAITLTGIYFRNINYFPITETWLLFITGRKLHPVYAFSFNYGMWWRSKRSGWALLGFIPVIRPLVAFASSVHVRKYRRLVARFCMSELFKSTIAARAGMFVDFTDDETTTKLFVFPRVPFNVADEPEMQSSFVGSKIGAMSAMPCSNCEVIPKEDGLFSVGKQRNSAVMRAIFPENGYGKAIDKNIAKALSDNFSLHSKWNPCWSIPGYDPFMNPGCIIHQLDHGVFDIVLELIISLLKTAFPAGSVGRFDVRWSLLASFPGGKKFKRGVSTLANATCSEHRIMSMGLPFAIRGFSPSKCSKRTREDDFADNASLPEFFMEDLAITYLCLRWILAKKRFTLQMRTCIEILGKRLWGLIDELHRHIHDDVTIELGTKLHKICHWVKWISMFGSPENWSSEIWEGAHKLVKRWRPSMSWKSAGSASRKVMRAQSVYDSHATVENSERASSAPITSQALSTLWQSVDMNAPPGWIPRKKFVSGVGGKRTGPGGFRGRTSAACVFTVSVDSRLHLSMWEQTSAHLRCTLHERVETYTSSVPAECRQDFGILIRLLSTTFRKNSAMCTTQPVDLLVDRNDQEGYPALRFFTGGNSHRSDPSHFVRFWNKTFVESNAEGSYATVGTFVHYRAKQKTTGRMKRSIGRLTWIVSVFGRQILILQKTRDIPVKGGPKYDENFVEQFKRQTSETHVCMDPLKRHFWTVQMLDDGTVSDFDVVVLPLAVSSGDSDSNPDDYPIEGVVMMQPDFLTLSINRFGKEYPTRWFLLEYVLL